jgi:predicted RNase H-like HicB family nuclease
MISGGIITHNVSYVNTLLSDRCKKMKKSFTMVIERDPESNWLVGEVVELPGCYTQAPDLPSLVANMEEAIRGYLKTMVRLR